MNLPGRIHVIDLREDSRLDMVETWATRKDSYWAKADDIESKDRREGNEEQAPLGGRPGGVERLQRMADGDLERTSAG